MPYDPANPLAKRAADILRSNDTGRLVKAAPSLYPHQWSWDAALISIGLAHIDLNRAIVEIRHLLRGQWRNGMIPQIQFNPDADPHAYFPDERRWASHLAPDAPNDIATSGIIQPPVHAIAVRQICDMATGEHSREIAREFYAPLREWHRYLHSARDPENSGLVTIVHPWESGMDNSPRWDTALARINVPTDDLPPYTRRDLEHVTDASQRPTNADYDRFLWIVEILKHGQYRVESMYAGLPFRVKDVFISALLVNANESLMHLATLAEADIDDLDLIDEWIESGRRGLAASWHGDPGRCLDTDLVTGEPIDVQTVALLAPIFAGQLSPAVRESMKNLWSGVRSTGGAGLKWPLPPTTSVGAPQFSATRYWRGPVWPVINWLLWYAWHRMGEFEIADDLRANALKQIEVSGFYEYMDPLTGEGLGSDEQSWTAAAVLDWLANDQPAKIVRLY